MSRLGHVKGADDVVLQAEFGVVDEPGVMVDEVPLLACITISIVDM